MLARIRTATEKREGGFTLIELLVVIIIIGILAAIAIPTFLNQREKAWKKAALSDLRNNASVMETWFDDKGTYADAPDSGFKESDDVTVTLAPGANATDYCLEAVHIKLKAPDNTFHLTGSVGKPQTGACPS